MILRRVCITVLVSALAVVFGGASLAQDGTEANLGTATPYLPQQDASTYQAPPAGFAPLYTQLVARHGSRGLSAPKADLAISKMLTSRDYSSGNARRDTLTGLGHQLSWDFNKIIYANAVLGSGVPGITQHGGRLGYGNETALGAQEHTALAQRMLARLPGLWTTVAGNAAGAPRQIVVVNSGVDRAADSAGFFVRSLTKARPELKQLISREPAPVGYPAGSPPKAQRVGTNRFLLYFHKLTPDQDLVTDPKDRYFQTYQDSQAYQEYLHGNAYNDKHRAILSALAGKGVGRAALERLFKRWRIDQLENGTVVFSNAGPVTLYKSGRRVQVVGDGKTKIRSAADAGLLLYQVYASAPAIAAESGLNMTPYLTVEHANVFAEVEDALAFYRLGPGITEQGDITYRMAQVLLDDFFAEVDAIARGDLKHAAKLRFAHAEIVAPFLSRLGLADAVVQMPASTVFSYASNPWRGARLVPMAANVQWDVYSDGRGGLLVRMLHNERETDFKAACDGAKLAPESRYYDYRRLKACYGYKS
jgi:hypothetical protein